MNEFQPIRRWQGSSRSFSTPFRTCLFWIAPLMILSIFNAIKQQSLLTSQWKEILPSVVDMAIYDASQYQNAVSTNHSSDHSNGNASDSQSVDFQRSSSTIPIFDIISIGSQKFPQLLSAQNQTFGRHKAVRHFFGVTEETDTEKTCHTNLTHDNIRQILLFCKNRKRHWPFSLNQMKQDFANRKWIFQKKEPVGWMCAQKRPMDAIKQYIDKLGLQHTDPINLPDYLLLMDDDTWVGMDNVVPLATELYPVDEPRAVAGCFVRKRIQEMNFTFGYGGYGHMLNKKALQNLIRPIHCSVDVDLASVNPLEEEDFEKLVCWRLEQSRVGEKQLFRNGMSVADLMHAYTFHNAYLNVNSWDARSVGFCMHSDWALGYFLNFYFISNKSSSAFSLRDVPEDRLEGFKQSQFYAGKRTSENKKRWGECMNSIDFQQLKGKGQAANGDPFCKSSASFCHRISPNHMHSLHDQALKAHGKDYWQ